MTASAIGRLGLFLKGSLPLLCTVLLVLLAALPWPIPHGGILPLISALVSIYFWSIYRPAQMPLGAAFMVGILVDLLSGGPLGATALVLVLLQWAAVEQRRSLAGKSFAVAWLGYMLISAGAMAIYWVLAALYHLSVIHAAPAVVTYTLGAAFYPLIVLLLSRVYRLTRGVDDGA